MKTLVTGHKGFIGSKLFSKLSSAIGIDLQDGQNLLTCDLPEDIGIIYHLAEGLLKAKYWTNKEYFMGSGIGTTVLELAEGKYARFEPERKEDREVVVPNTCPNWKPTVNVLEYIRS